MTRLARGSAVTFVPMYAELPAQRAAEFLNVSRPYRNRLLDEGTVPVREDGSGRRILFRDLAETRSAFKLATDNYRLSIRCHHDFAS